MRRSLGVNILRTIGEDRMSLPHPMISHIRCACQGVKPKGYFSDVDVLGVQSFLVSKHNPGAMIVRNMMNPKRLHKTHSSLAPEKSTAPHPGTVHSGIPYRPDWADTASHRGEAV
jgi:hypothetical protein